MAKHTPGPWYVARDGHVYSEASREDAVSSMERGFRCVAFTSHRDQRFSSPAESKANARLISAAPDLLVALRAATAAIETLQVALGRTEWPEKDSGGWNEACVAYDNAHAAIAKAEA